MNIQINLDKDRIGNRSHLNYSSNQLLRMPCMIIKIYTGKSIISVFAGSRGVDRPKIRSQQVRDADVKRVARSLANKFKITRENIEVLYENSTENKNP